jgi:hypothetical protein
VYQESAPSTDFEIDIEVRDIIAKRPSGGGLAHGDIDNCDDNWSTSLGIYFMYVDDTGVITSNTIRWDQTGVDIKGPTPPENVTASPSKERLFTHWDPSSTLGSLTYNIYCSEAGAGQEPAYVGDAGLSSLLDAGSTLASDAGGDAGDAGFDAAVAPAAQAATTSTSVPVTSETADGGAEQCWGQGLRAGRVPSSTLEVCGTQSSDNATDAYATDLTNGVRYAVAVAAVDELGNPGKLSNVACGVPVNTKGFIDTYVQDGGGGGGGICAVAEIGQATPRSRGTQLFIAAGLVLGCAFWGRRSAKRTMTCRVERNS